MLWDRKGVSLLYVLMALVCVGAVGSLVLNMAKKESGDSSLRKSSELARFASTAGLVYATNFFTDPVKEAQSSALLQKWFKHYIKSSDPAPTEDERWIVGTKNTYYTDPATGMKFRAKVTDMDFSSLESVTEEDNGVVKFKKDPKNSSINVKIECESIDKSGSRAKNFGFYKIIGYEILQTSDETPTHALYMGGGNMWIHCPITVNGSAYIGRKSGSTQAIKHNQGTVAPSSKSYYKGEFILFQGDPSYYVELADEVFEGPAFFEGGQVLFTHNSVEQSIFEKGFGGNAIFKVTAQGYPLVRNGASPSQKNFVMLSGGLEKGNYASLVFENSGTNAELYYIKGSNFSPDPGFYTGGPSLVYTPPNIDIDEIVAKLNIKKRNPPAHKIVLKQEITDKMVNTGNPYYNGQLTETVLTNLWNQGYSSGKNYTDEAGNSWLVLEISSNSMNPISTDGSSFTNKAIIVHKATTLSTNGFFRVSGNGNILFYVHEGVVSGGTGLAAYQLAGSYRGMFYNASSNAPLNLSAEGGNGWIVNGAFYNAPQTPGATSNAVIQLGTAGAGRITVNYDAAALQEFVDMGIVKPSDDATKTDEFISRIPQSLQEFVFAEQVGRWF